MLKTILITALVLTALGGCIGTSGPVAYRTDPGASVRTARVPTTLMGIDGQPGVLILGVQ